MSIIEDVKRVKENINEEKERIKTSKKEIIQAEKLMGLSRKRRMVGLICILFLFLIFFSMINLVLFNIMGEKEVIYVPQIVERQPIIYETTKEVIKNIQIQLNNTDQMICLENPNGEMNCYKEK